MVDFEKIDFFTAESISDTKDLISDVIYSNDRGVYIISGEKGVGKSRLIKQIVDEVKEDIFLITQPPRLEREFLEESYLQLRQKHFSKSVKIDEMRIRVNDAFKKINHTIIIDNIGESLTPLIDDIGKSIDMIKDLKIVMVIDKTFSDENDLNRTFIFKTQEHIEVPQISKQDLGEFLKGLENGNIYFRSLDFIFDATAGNFQKVQDLIKTALEIVEFGTKENLDKFKILNECMLIMSAFENELING
jgi:hypothetical protein